ncbi:MAG: 4-oxalocrotonate tautomerase [Lentisphaeria bacterium]|nr:4-oxalocrotonate tautomerase [Lentisphaeria bacterium]
MPVITLEISKLNPGQKKQLVREMTETVVKVTKLPPETVTVFLKENELDNIGFGGKLLSEKQAPEGEMNE